MARYDTEFEILVNRATSEGTIDLGTWIEKRIRHGVSGSAIIDDLMYDLDNAGPIFGKFFRSMGGAAASATLTAARQGEIVGYAADSAALRDLLARADIDGPVLDHVLDEADPEGAQAIEDVIADRVMETWVATLRRTCPRCLPLHGKTMTHAEWLASGYSPETIHDGWDSPCYCRLVPAEYAGEDLKAPLMRVAAEKGTGRTKRSILSAELQTAINARDKAMQSEEGKRMLSRLGSALRE